MPKYMILISAIDEPSTVKLFNTYDDAARYGNIAVANGYIATLFELADTDNNYVEIFEF